MQAVLRREYGSPDGVELREVEKPSPGADEVLVQVRAASLNASDIEGLTGEPLYVRLLGGLRRPRIPFLGSDVAGRVAAVGRKVTRFRPGDAVLGDTLYHGMAGFSEYVTIPESAPLAHKPEPLTFEQAATLPQAGVIALQGIRDRGRVQAGQRVVINGAGGGAGTFAVQLARSRGAEVTAVDRGDKLDMLRSLGADHVVDYTREDFTRGGPRYDLILDLAAHRSIFDHRRALSPHGVYALVGGSMASLLRTLALGPLISATGSRKMGLLAIRPNSEDLATIAELVARGELACVVDRVYPLREAPEALRYQAAGRNRGKVVITI